MHVVKDEKTLLNDKLIIEEATISQSGKEFKRLRVKREDASAILILNTDTNNIILTKQFRYPLHDKITESILEIPAGKVEEGEDPLSTAIREAEEETGYRIQPDHIQLLMSCFSTPGYSTECFHIFYATVTHTNKVSKGGGLASENESIEILEIDSDEFIKLIRNGKIKDAKTCIAGLYFSNYI